MQPSPAIRSFALAFLVALAGCDAGRDEPRPAGVDAAAAAAAREALVAGPEALATVGADGAPGPDAAPGTASEPALAPPRLGLWVLCEGSERTLESPVRIARLLETSRDLGVTDLFVQVYRGGRAWFDSSLADAGPWRELVRDGRPDPLRQLVAGAHAQGQRVHAWVNVLSLGQRREGPLQERLGADAVQVDRRGRSLLDYPDFEVPADERRWVRMGTPALWLDPGAPGVQEAVTAALGELVARYPELDGLHLDYVRYPDVLPFVPGARFDVGLDFGFGEATRARFRAETGLEAPFADDSRNAAAFDRWRRAQVTALVRAIGDAGRAARPDLALSAAVWAFPDRTFLSLHQDWTRWLEDGLASFAVPMAYTRDPALFTLLARANAALGQGRAWLGLGTWLAASEPADAVAQLREARALPLAGIALFSWDAIAASPTLEAALREEAAQAAAPVLAVP